MLSDLTKALLPSSLRTCGQCRYLRMHHVVVFAEPVDDARIVKQLLIVLATVRCVCKTAQLRKAYVHAARYCKILPTADQHEAVPGVHVLEGVLDEVREHEGTHEDSGGGSVRIAEHAGHQTGPVELRADAGWLHLTRRELGS